MLNSVAGRRADIARAFSSKKCEPPHLEHTGLRFSLGTSIAELKVPFHTTPEISHILNASGRQLAAMLLTRHRELVRSDESDKLLVGEEFASIPQAPRTFALTSGGPEIRATAELGFELHPLLTPPVVVAWLSPGGGGRSLVALVIEILRKAFGEMRGCNGKEETPALTALMLATLLPGAEASIRALGIPGPADRMFAAAAGVGMCLAIRLGVERALREGKAAPDLAMRVEAALSPTALLGGRPGIGKGGNRFFGVDLGGGVPLVDEILARLSGGINSKQAEEVLTRHIAADKTVSHFAEKDVVFGFLREHFRQLALLGEQFPLAGLLPDKARTYASQPPALTALLLNVNERRELGKDLTKRAEKQTAQARAVLAQLGTALSGYREDDPASCIAATRTTAHVRYAGACFAAIADLWLEQAISTSRRALEVRTGAESEDGLEGEYALGRLYRLSAGPEPMLATAKAAPVAHLFVDVKDFTRRTNLLGQVAIAEFLRTEFYVPILASAKQHYRGMAHLTDRGGVTINNLLGDAISMSGDIEALVALALEIRQHLIKYEQQLAKAVSGEEMAHALRTIHEDFARKVQAAGPGGPIAQLEAERDLALARARGEGLEAGVFISFGPPPLVVTIEDEIFGRQRVAIADRINESARGTARSGGARARADAMITAERSRRADPRLSHPWAVFVGNPFNVSIPVAAEDAARLAVRSGNLPAAMRAVADPVKRAVEDTVRTEEAPGDIYNAGAALSEEALLAFQQALGDERVFRRIEVSPGQLHPEVTRRYFLPPRPQRFIASFQRDGKLAELFRQAGRVMFKGLERSGGITVWELVGEAGFLKLIELHHAPTWFGKGSG